MKQWKKIVAMVLFAAFVFGVCTAARYEYLSVYDLEVLGSFTGTGKITTTHILDETIAAADIDDIERQFDLPLNGFWIDGTSLLGAFNSTSPGFVERDSVPALVWDAAETYKIQITFRVPGDFSESMGFRVLASESSDTTPCSIDYRIWRNSDAAVFAATPEEFAAVALSASASTNEVVDLATTQSLTAGEWITLDIWNAGTGNGQLEIKGSISAYYIATM